MLDCALFCVNEISRYRYPSPPILTARLLMCHGCSLCLLPFQFRAQYVYCLYLYRFLKGSAAEEACAAVASAVGSNPILMTELDLSKRIPEALGVTQLCALLEDSHCTLQKLRLVDAAKFSSINIH